MSAALCVFAQNGVIRELHGDVEIRPAGAAAFIPAAVGSIVARDTVVSTGFRSTAIIQVGNSTLTVRPLTRLLLTDIQAAAGSETVGANLQAGRVRIDVNPPAGATAAFSVQSPSATASVRGTSFEFNTRSVSVLEGSVSFSGTSGSPVAIRPGGESTVGGGGRVSDPVFTVFQNLFPPVPVGTGVSGEVIFAPVLVPAVGDIFISLPYP